MMNFKNSKTAKAISGIVGLATAVMMMGPAVASAATVEELTAQINALLAQVAALQASQQTSSSSSSSSQTTTGHVFTVDLTIGSRGADVVALQTVLVTKGFLTMPAGVAMGYFGPLTRAALAQWQVSVGIAPTAGYFGPKSRAAFNAMVSSSTTTNTTTTTTTTWPSGCTSSVGFSPTTGLSCATGTVVVSGSGVSALLDTASPGAHTVIAGQSVATLAIFKLTNGGATAAKVTSVQLKRTGVSSDTTLSNVYLYNGATRLTDSASVSAGVSTFNDTAGIVTIPAGGSVSITARADIAASTNGQTVGVMLTGVTTDVGVATGVPVSGAESSIASAPTDMMTANYSTAAATPAAASIDPQSDYTMWQENLAIGSHDANLSSIRLRQIGSVNTGDLRNFRFYVDGTQVGTTVESLDANSYVTFTFATPVTLKAGTRVLKMVGDIVGGSNRNFTFSLRQAGDAEIMDSQLGVTVLPTVNNAAFAAVSTGTQTVNQGTLTITKSTDSPSGNVVLEGSGVTLAKFDVKAQGERLKVESLRAYHTASTALWTGIRNGALFLNGVQIGSTATINEVNQATPYTQFNLGSSMVLEPGTAYTLEVRGDVHNTSSVANTSLVAGTTTTVSITAAASTVQRMTSLSYITGAQTASANQLTVAAGSVAVAKYSAYANQTAVVPQTAYKLGEFRVTTGSTEAVNLDTITVQLLGDANGTAGIAAGYITNLYVVYGSKTSTTKATGAATQSWSVNEAVAANSTLAFSVYGTISSSMTGIASTTLVVSGTSQSSGNAVTSGTAVAGQNITVGQGSISSAVDASTPVSALVVANSMPKVASFKFTSTNDTFTIDELTAKVATAADAAAIKNLVFKDGGTTLATQPMNGIYATSSGLTIAVGINGTKVIDVYADLGSIGTGFASTSANVAVTLDGFEYQNSNGVKTRDYTDRAGNATYAYKTKPTVTNAALPTSVLNPGTATIGKVTITADAGGTIAWRKIVWTYATSTPSGSFTMTSAGLYDESGTAVSGVTVTTGTGATGSITASSTAGAADQEVSGSKTYTLKATIGGSPVTSSSITTNIATGVGTFVASTDATTVAGTAASFVWSDESSSPHSALTQDWNNDAFVKNIPTDSQSLTK